MRISWAWRNRARHNLPRLLGVIIVPLLCFVGFINGTDAGIGKGFTAASILSAKVTAPPYTASQVRLNKQNCGFLDWTAGSNVLGDVSQEGARVYSTYFVNNAIAARNYARSCYGSQSQNLASCNIYPVSSLQYTTDSKAACPFGGSRCVLGDEAAIQMRTPWLNSHVHFGINAPRADQIEYRRTTTCSVVNVTDLIGSRISSSGTTYSWYLGYVGSLKARSNVTYIYNDNTANLNIGYTIKPGFAVESDDYLGWIPTPDLKRTDADVSIFFLAPNSVVYSHPVDDPMYSAHRKIDTSITQTPTAYYASDNLVTVVACIDQASMRDPNTNLSTLPSGLQSLKNQSASLGLNDAQLASALRLISPSESSLMFNSVNGLQAAALKAQDSLYITVSPGLPDNQWQLEVQGWFDTALAQLQSAVVSFVAKDVDDLSPYARLTNITDKANMDRMCDNQIILATGNYQSFSLMGIEIIVVGGILILLLSFVVEGLVGWGQEHCCGGRRRYKKVLWSTDSVLQTHRLVAGLVGVGESDWEVIEGEVPVTKKGKVWRSEPLMDYLAKM